MSWSIDVYIDEMRPWPDTVNVIRGKTDKVRRFIPEELRTCALLDGAALMGENRRLRESNDKLRELLEDMAVCACGKYCYGCPHQYDGCDRDQKLREFGIEVER